MAALLVILWFIAVVVFGLLTWGFLGGFVFCRMFGSKELDWARWVVLFGAAVLVVLVINHPF